MQPFDCNCQFSPCLMMPAARLSALSVPVLQLICFFCQKDSTGPLNRDSLITHINEEGMKDPGKEDIVPFEAGKKRGHVYIPKYNEAELEAMAKKEADAVTLECDEEEALVRIF